MARVVFLSEKGFTLIEALVALVLLAIMLLGLLAGMLTVFQHNLLNFMREDAGSVAQECIENIRSIPFQDLTDVNISCNSSTKIAVNTPCLNTGGANVVRRQVRNTTVDYRVGWSIADRGGNLKEVAVEVCWGYRGKTYSYNARTFIGR